MVRHEIAIYLVHDGCFHALRLVEGYSGVSVREKLKTKAALRCSCKKEIHTEKCTLFSMMHGVRKWPGMNVGVTEDDLEFLAQRDLVAKRQRRA